MHSSSVCAGGAGTIVFLEVILRRLQLVLDSLQLILVRPQDLEPEDGPLLRVLLVQDRRRVEVLRQLLMALEARIAHCRDLRVGVCHDFTPEATLHQNIKLVHVRRRDEVHEGKARGDIPVLLARHVEEGVPLVQVTTLEEAQEVLARFVAGEVSHHDSGAGITPTLDLVGVDVVLGELLRGDLGAVGAGDHALGVHGLIAVAVAGCCSARRCGGCCRRRRIEACVAGALLARLVCLHHRGPLVTAHQARWRSARTELLAVASPARPLPQQALHQARRTPRQHGTQGFQPCPSGCGGATESRRHLLGLSTLAGADARGGSAARSCQEHLR
mmetsp:Transcript_25085/g.56935  ORF Transcript_25085/g.56935 Transcript_25085/m.56935 type:complete len:330 (-) Transcript_25085:577-1566(-)